MQKTKLYHPHFTPQLNWNFASYTEYTEANPEELTINGETRMFPCIELRDGTSVQQAKMNGWKIVPEQPVLEKPKSRKQKKKKVS